MPDLLEHMYCSQQINIPPNLPFILKQYAKAAIRTQPNDLLYWSAAYFRAKANNTPPPVKERFEYPPFDSPSRLSPGFLKVLHKQLGENETIPVQELYERWLGVCLVKEALDNMLQVGELNTTNTIAWLKFVTVAAGHLCSSLSKTMVLVCEVLTKEPEGGSAMIPVDVFVDLYQFLARLDCGPETSQAMATCERIGDSIVSESTTTNTSVVSESIKEITVIKPVEEKDSSAGLMVWEDLKPEDREERVSTPKYTEELGASSELGIEVLDDATGPVIEAITIISPVTEKDLLSHSSLKENDNWLKIEPKKQKENIEESVGLSSSPTDLVLETTESKAGNISEVEQDVSIEETEEANLQNSESSVKEHTIEAAETVIHLRLPEDESSTSLSNEELAKESERERSTARDYGVHKQHIPGIGPVIPEHQILAVVEYMQFKASKQGGCVMPSNINHLLCPPLDFPPASSQ